MFRYSAPTLDLVRFLLQFSLERRQRFVRGWLSNQWVDEKSESKCNDGIQVYRHGAGDQSPAVLLAEGKFMRNVSEIRIVGDEPKLARWFIR